MGGTVDALVTAFDLLVILVIGTPLLWHNEYWEFLGR